MINERLLLLENSSLQNRYSVFSLTHFFSSPHSSLKNSDIGSLSTQLQKQFNKKILFGICSKLQIQSLPHQCIAMAHQRYLMSALLMRAGDTAHSALSENKYTQHCWNCDLSIAMNKEIIFTQKLRRSLQCGNAAREAFFFCSACAHSHKTRVDRSMHPVDASTAIGSNDSLETLIFAAHCSLPAPPRKDQWPWFPRAIGVLL